jgi:hypothetical protein
MAVFGKFVDRRLWLFISPLTFARFHSNYDVENVRRDGYGNY